MRPIYRCHFPIRVICANLLFLLVTLTCMVELLKPHYVSVNLYCICIYTLWYCIVYFVHMHACMYVRMYVCTYVCMYVCTYVYMYVCMHVCMYVCMYVRMYVFHFPQPEDTQQLVRMASLIGDIKQHELSYLKMLQQLMVCTYVWSSCSTVTPFAAL